MDDGVLVGPATELSKALPLIQTSAALVGLHLNLSKCDAWSTQPIPLNTFPPEVSIKEEGIELLGAPIGPDSFITPFIHAKVQECTHLWEALPSLDDPQTELLLLRMCLSFCKLSYLLRTTPLHQFDWSQYDIGIRASLCNILETTLPDTAWLQATLPLKYGGLGLLSPARLAQSAFIGSLLFTQQLLELHVNPNNAPLHLSQLIQDIHSSLAIDPDTEFPTTSCQKFLSDIVHRQTAQDLLAHLASSPRDSCRLRSLSLPHSTAFLQAFPNHHTGTGLSGQDFRFAVKWLLGLPIIPQPILCPACQDTFDIFGDHALCCQQGNDRTHLHNSIRDVLASVAVQGFGSSNVKVEVGASRNRKAPPR